MGRVRKLIASKPTPQRVKVEMSEAQFRDYKRLLKGVVGAVTWAEWAKNRRPRVYRRAIRSPE
jgi:hypothetical protein